MKKRKIYTGKKSAVQLLAIVVGFTMFIIGWLSIVYSEGIDVVKRSYVISIPRKYLGEVVLSPEGGQRLSLRPITEVYNVSIREGVRESVANFSTNTRYMWATIKIKGRALDKDFVDMVIYLSKANGTIVGSTRIANRSSSVDAEYVLTAGPIDEGEYLLTIISNTDMHIDHISLRGLYYETSPNPSISIVLTPREFNHHTLYYIDKIDLKGLWISVSIIFIGFAIASTATISYVITRTRTETC